MGLKAGSNISLACLQFVAALMSYDMMKALKYREAFELFERLDWDMIDDVAKNGSKASRVQCAHGQLQTLVFRLTDRPNGKDLSDEEMNMFCKTLQACWRVWSDYHTPLHMLVDFFNEKLELCKIKSLDAETLSVLAQMHSHTHWPNNP